MRVLLVEDDPVTASIINLALRREEFICDIADLGSEAIQHGKSRIYDLIILDLILPDMDGLVVLRELRGSGVYTPALILSALNELDSKVGGLRSGADDYLTKPFEQRELIARIHAILRRSTTHPESTIRFGKLLVNVDNHTATVDDQPLHLTIKEYEILEFLCLSIGKPITRQTLLNRLYRGRDEPKPKIIDVFVCRLRHKLAQASGGDSHIETIRDQGFRLREQVEFIPERRRA